MIPWVVLGLMLAFGILVSVLYTGISFLVDGDHFNGWMWLILGTVSFSKYIFNYDIIIFLKFQTD